MPDSVVTSAVHYCSTLEPASASCPEHFTTAISTSNSAIIYLRARGPVAPEKTIPAAIWIQHILSHRYE